MVVKKYEIQCFRNYFAKSVFVLTFVQEQNSSQAPTRGSSPLITTEQVYLKTKRKFIMWLIKTDSDWRSISTINVQTKIQEDCYSKDATAEEFGLGGSVCLP